MASSMTVSIMHFLAFLEISSLSNNMHNCLACSSIFWIVSEFCWLLEMSPKLKPQFGWQSDSQRSFLPSRFINQKSICLNYKMYFSQFRNVSVSSAKCILEKLKATKWCSLLSGLNEQIELPPFVQQIEYFCFNTFIQLKSDRPLHNILLQEERRGVA